MKVQTAEAVHVGVEALRAHPLRTVLSTLGVVIGVAALVAILALGDGLEAFSREQLESTTDLQMITVESRTVERAEGVVIRRENVTVLTVDDEAELAQQLAGAARVSLMLNGPAWARLDTVRRAALVTAGTPGMLAQFEGARMSAGRFVDAEDVHKAVPVAVVSERLVEEMAAGRSASAVLGETLSIGAAAYRVIGVVAEGGQSRKPGSGAAAFRPPPRVIVPVTAAPSEVGSGLTGARTPTLAIKANRIEDVPALRDRVTAWLAARYRGRSEDFTVGTSERRVDQARQGLLVMRLALGSITGISILVGGIGIMNIMLASVHERTREIGIRKAAGARRRDILLQFLAESVTISGVGSAIGVVVGLSGAIGITALIRALTDAPLHAAFTWTTLLVAACIAILVGVAFGTYPARRAAALSPIDAIRHE